LGDNQQASRGLAHIAIHFSGVVREYAQPEQFLHQVIRIGRRILLRDAQKHQQPPATDAAISWSTVTLACLTRWTRIRIFGHYLDASPKPLCYSMHGELMARGKNVEDLTTLEMALVGYQVEKQKIEARIAEIQAQLAGKAVASPSAAAEKKGAPKRVLSPAARKRMPGRRRSVGPSTASA